MSTCRFTVSEFMMTTSDGLAPTIRAMSSRQSSSAVTHGRVAFTPGKWPSTPQRCHFSSSSRT